MAKFIFSSLVFFLFFSNHLLVAQVKSGIVIYGVSADEFADRVKKTNEAKGVFRKSTFESIAEEMHRIELILSFNDSISLFERSSDLAVEHSEKIFRLAVAFAYRGGYYTNLKSEQLLLNREFFGSDIIVESELNKRDWELTSEQKKIGEFDCYKAISSIETTSGEYPIVAWYAPEIPFAFGPSDYGGNLPGLILELLTNEASYYVKEIELNPKKKILIKWPSDDKAITPEEYKKIDQDLKKRYKKNN